MLSKRSKVLLQLSWRRGFLDHQVKFIPKGSLKPAFRWAPPEISAAHGSDASGEKIFPCMNPAFPREGIQQASVAAHPGPTDNGPQG